MSFKDVLVHVDGGGRSTARLDVATQVAQVFGARLTGLFGQSDPHVLILATRDPETALAPIAARSETAFRERVSVARVAGEWLVEATVNDTELVKRLLMAARHADLAILGQYEPEAPQAGVPADLIEHVVLGSGRPVLVVPFAGYFASVGRRVMVAWNGGREAARAVGDAIPFLERAEKVILISVNPDIGRREAEAPVFGPILRHLSAHGIDAAPEILWVKDIGAMDILLSRLTDDSIDLLVMGAHGGYGIPHLHRSAATRHILRHMTVPVLMSH